MSACLNSLQTQLTRLRDREAAINNRLRILRNRRDDITNLITQLVRASSNNVPAANREIRNIIVGIADGIHFPSGDSRLRAIVENREEREADSDSNLSEAGMNLSTELRRVNDEIAALEQELAQVQRELRSINADIRTENAQIRQDNLDRLLRRD